MSVSPFPSPVVLASSEYFVYLDRTVHREGTNSYSNVSSASWVSGAVLKIENDAATARVSCSRQVESVMINLRRQPTPHVLAQIIEDGRLHMDVRIQLLAQQIILVYKTGYSYMDQKSRWRICHKMEKAVAGDEAKSCYQAAHCNLFPEMGLLLDPTQGEFIPFPKTSWLCSTWNTTTLLPTTWNQTDTMLDGQNSNRSSFRAQITQVLNQAAKVDAGSCVGYYNDILIKMAARLDACIRKYEQETETHKYIIPLRCYREVVEQYLNRTRAGDNMLAWACMEPSLDTEQAIHAVQARIWKMTQIEAHSFLAVKRFSPHAQLFKPMQSQNTGLLRAPMRLLETQIPVQGPGVVTRSERAHIMQDMTQLDPVLAMPVIHSIVPHIAADLVVTPVAMASQTTQTLYFRDLVHLEKKGMQYKNHCLQDQTIQTIAERHWQAGGHSQVELAPMKERMRLLIHEKFGIKAPKHQEEIATCIFAHFYPTTQVLTS